MTCDAPRRLLSRKSGNDDMSRLALTGTRRRMSNESAAHHVEGCPREMSASVRFIEVLRCSAANTNSSQSKALEENFFSI
jgi:hypothetical protein